MKHSLLLDCFVLDRLPKHLVRDHHHQLFVPKLFVAAAHRYLVRYLELLISKLLIGRVALSHRQDVGAVEHLQSQT